VLNVEPVSSPPRKDELCEIILGEYGDAAGNLTGKSESRTKTPFDLVEAGGSSF
jgi:hypothetical protein